MEENETEQEQLADSVFDVNMSASIIYSLQEACRWATRLVYFSGGIILAFVLLILFNLDDFYRGLYVSSGDRYNNNASAVGLGVLAFIGAVYITFLVLLFIFSRRVNKGLNEKNTEQVERGFALLKAYFILSASLSMLFCLLFLFQMYTILTA
jgi:hypothetical protein